MYPWFFFYSLAVWWLREGECWTGSDTLKEDMKQKTSEQVSKWRLSGRALEEDRSCGGNKLLEGTWKPGTSGGMGHWQGTMERYCQEGPESLERWKGICNARNTAQGDGGERWARWEILRWPDSVQLRLQCSKVRTTSFVAPPNMRMSLFFGHDS